MSPRSPSFALASVLGFVALLSVAISSCAKPTPSGGDQCPAGGLSCGGMCVDPMTDESNCGACGVACMSGFSCQQGTCRCQGGLIACGNLCVSLTSDPAHCGGCQTSCTGGQVCNQSTCSSSCSAGLTNCSGACVALMTDSQNCGSCGHACAAGQGCSGGQCGCAAGQMLCGTNCVDVSVSTVNCGSCGHTCGAGQTCSAGACVGGTGNGGSNGGGGAAGGASGAGGAGGAAGGDGGVTMPMPKALTCSGGVNVAAADVISDFTQATPIMYQSGMRGGTSWYSYAATTDSTPGMGANTIFAVDKTQTDPCNSGGSLHVKSPGNTGYGVGFGVNMAPDAAAMKKGIWNANGTGYTGIGFFMKCSTETPFGFFKIVDAENDASVVSPTCTDSAAPFCNQYGIKNVSIESSWTYYQTYFSELLQDPRIGTSWGNGLDTSKLTAFQIQMNTPYDQSGANPTQTPFECWVADVHFLKSTPAAPVTTCASGYTVSGNHIACGTTTKVFRGVARPSMEWDGAGWNVTPWDMGVLKNTWKANVVRIGVNQDFYVNKYPGIYGKYVARAVKWAEAAGMDVILDLHWINQTMGTTQQGVMASASTASTTFWTQFATAFKSDPHILFELYNEPTLGGGSPQTSDWTTWKQNAQDLYNAVRTGAGANNIVIVGGLNWSYDLSMVSPATGTKFAITGTNIAYNTHPYSNKAPQSDWDGKFGYLTANFPVFATEFGSYDCSGSFSQSLITYMESKGMSWTAWGWYAGGGCAFPSLISDYTGAVLNGAGSNADATKQGLTKNP
jgi:hypothetical protein